MIELIKRKIQHALRLRRAYTQTERLTVWFRAMHKPIARATDKRDWHCGVRIVDKKEDIE